MEIQDDGVFDHDEADVTMVSYVLKYANNGKGVIRVLSDDTDVFVLLVYWVYQADLELLCKVQTEWWDGAVLNINATCADLGLKCLQLLGMHALSRCDTTSYPYGKAKMSAFNTLIAHDCPGVADVLGEVGTTHTDLVEAEKPFYAALYHQLSGTSWNLLASNFSPRRKTSLTMALPPRSANLLQHVLRAHLQTML